MQSKSATEIAVDNADVVVVTSDEHLQPIEISKKPSNDEHLFKKPLDTKNFPRLKLRKELEIQKQLNGTKNFKEFYFTPQKSFTGESLDFRKEFSDEKEPDNCKWKRKTLDIKTESTKKVVKLFSISKEDTKEVAISDFNNSKCKIVEPKNKLGGSTNSKTCQALSMPSLFDKNEGQYPNKRPLTKAALKYFEDDKNKMANAQFQDKTPSLSFSMNIRCIEEVLQQVINSKKKP